MSMYNFMNYAMSVYLSVWWIQWRLLPPDFSTEGGEEIDTATQITCALGCISVILSEGLVS
jgi:hypothetical protein